MFLTGILDRRALVLLLAFTVFPIALRAQMVVDCTGNDPSAFPNINSALAFAGPGTTIIVEAGPCNESVDLWGQNNLTLGAWWGQSVIINGRVGVNNSQSVTLYGLIVSNSAGDGITVANSRSTIVDTCTSNGNGGAGLRVQGLSDVAVQSSGAFDGNSSGGISIADNSYVTLLAWGGPIDISNNIGSGIYASRGSISVLGNVTIANNAYQSDLATGLGVDLRGGATAQFGGIFGPNTIQHNQSGGAWLQENSEISFWRVGGFPNVIQSNGPFGVKASFGSQVTFYDGAQISDHAGPGVEAIANSQIYFAGRNHVLRNGTSTDPQSAGIRVDGNSEVFMRGGEVSSNNGPALLALVNSSVDFTGVTFQGNSAGIISCDSTATMVSDLAGPNSTPPAGVRCKVPHSLGNRVLSKTPPTTPDISAYKAAQARYKKALTKH